MGGVLKVNMKKIEWDNEYVYVNVTYGCYSQSKYEKTWVR
jgi:hypothetical protein